MEIIALQHPDYRKYLLHVFEKHCHGGLPPEELGLAADVFIALNNPQVLPVPTKTTEPTPGGVSLSEAANVGELT